MSAKGVQILDAEKIDKIIKRIAHQILENFFGEKEIIMVGIDRQGFLFAERIQTEIHQLSDLNVRLFKLRFDKLNPLEEEYDFSGKMSDLEKANIVLVDDVLNSGKTLAYALRFIMEVNVKQIFSTVLIDRFHRRYPVRADFVGLTLSTTLQEHIAVELEGNQDAAFVN
ncbi:MAG: phosphoribosyltransferase family protein [Bacteroidota bacterium]